MIKMVTLEFRKTMVKSNLIKGGTKALHFLIMPTQIY